MVAVTNKSLMKRFLNKQKDVFDIIEKKIHCIKLQMSRIRLIYCKQICTLYFYVRKIATL